VRGAGNPWKPFAQSEKYSTNTTARRSEMSRLARPRKDYTEWTLTPRRRDVLLGIRSYKTNKEIARQMNVSVSTVKGHIHLMLKRHGLKHRRQLVKLLGPDGTYDPLDIACLAKKIESLEGAVMHLADQVSSKEETSERALH